MEECLDSVRAQRYPAVELVILDDCSTDGSVERIRKWIEATGTDATFVVNEANAGICRSRNRALRYAHGEYVSFISADDWWLPDKLDHQVDMMQQRPGAGVVYCDAVQVDDAGRPLPRTILDVVDRGFACPPEGRIFDLLLVGNLIPPGPLVRRQCLDEVGPYDESLTYEDWDMWLRVAQQYEFAFSTSPDVVKRELDNSLWKTLGDARRTTDLRILLKHVDRCPSLWSRVAVLAYETGHPRQRSYFLAALHHRFSWRVLRFYLQSLVGFRYQQAQRLKQALSRRARASGSETRAGGTRTAP